MSMPHTAVCECHQTPAASCRTGSSGSRLRTRIDMTVYTMAGLMDVLSVVSRLGAHFECVHAEGNSVNFVVIASHQVAKRLPKLLEQSLAVRRVNAVTAEAESDELSSSELWSRT